MNATTMEWISQLALHQLWLSLAIAGLVWAAIRVRSTWSAETRYGVWSGALIVMAVLPLLMLAPKVRWQGADVLATLPSVFSERNVVTAVVAPERVVTLVPAQSQAQAWPLAIVFVSVWIAGMSWRLSSIARGLVILRRWRNAATPLAASTLERWTPALVGIDVRESADVATPMVVGVLHPCILIPHGLHEKLGEEQIALVLSHELAHVRRRDPLQSLVQRLIAAVYFYNPAIHWVARQVDRERECSCDDRVVSKDRNGEAYASSLISVARHVAGMPAPAEAVGVIGRSSQLKHRIERLIGREHHAEVAPSWFAVGSVTSLLLAAAIVFAPSVPLAQEAGASVRRNGDAASQESVQSLLGAAGGRSDDGRIANRAMGRVLVEAAQRGDLSAARDLVAAGADVNFAVPGDGTALIMASRRGDVTFAELLVSSGADVNQAVRGDGNPLIGASARGDLGIVKLLVEHGADVNYYIPGDETPLINAARRGHLDVVDYLVTKGADVNLAVRDAPYPGSELRSPLGEALKHGEKRVADRLKELGATTSDSEG
jgi:bla regulator protein blaR1